MTHNPYQTVTRRPLTSKQKLRMFLDAGGICCICGMPINGIKEAWDEHVLPLSIGGSNDDSNRRPAHGKCARAKSGSETTLRKKSERVAERHFGAKKNSNPIPGSRNSKWKKKMDGRVVKR